jgi:hypothetical protein
MRESRISAARFFASFAGRVIAFRDRRKATREPFMFAEVIASVPWCRTTRMRLARPRRSVIDCRGGAASHRSDCAAFDH